MRLQLAQYSPLSMATLLVLLSACSGDLAQPGQASDRGAALTSSALASDAGANAGSVADAAPTSRALGRPVLERRSSTEAQRESPATSRVDTTDAQPGAAPDSDQDVDPGVDHDTDDDGQAEGDDGDAEHDGAIADDDSQADDGRAEDEDSQGDDDDGDSDAEDNGEPEVSRRDRTLAWLAEDSGVLLPAATARTGAGGSVPRLVLPEEPPEFPRPDAVKGLYVSAWAAGSSTRSQGLIDIAARTEVNTFVIDLKDASGYVSYPTGVMTAREAGADQEIRIRDLPGLLERLRVAGIYPIARIVIVKDPLLIRSKPEWAVQDSAGGVWVDSKGLLWANLHDQRVWDYHIELAKEAAAVGFPEIQWDYVRFADAPQEDLDRAVYPGADGRRRRDAVEAFLEYAQAELEESGVAMTVDVFGATTSAQSDVGIGQYWERFIGSVEVALPMVYPSHYWVGSFGIQDPNGHPYEVVRAALVSGLQRSATVEGAGVIRPWLQDFTLGSPRYEAPEVRAQIQATYDAGIDEWLLWNASSRYTEAALEPADGFPEGFEPVMRAGGRIVPVSERYVAMALEAEERAVARMVADSITAAAVADSLAAVEASVPVVDSLATDAR